MQGKNILAVVIASILLGSIPCFGRTLLPTAPIMLADKPKGDPVDIDKLPKAVVDAVQKELPGAHLTKAMKLADGNYLLTDVKVRKKEYTVTVTPGGKILKREEDND
jgi:hypothetical protein